MHTLVYWHIEERRQVEIAALSYDEVLFTARLLWPSPKIGWMRMLDENNRLVRLWSPNPELKAAC
jgi:hypothetical protein